MRIVAKREKIGPYDTVLISIGNENIRLRYSDFDYYLQRLGQRKAIIRAIEDELQRAEIHVFDII